jgi:hypothetical protein
VSLPDFGRGLYATRADLDYLESLVKSPSVGELLDRERLARCYRTVAQVLKRAEDDTKETTIPTGQEASQR